MALGTTGDAELAPEELSRRWALVWEHRERALRVARARTTSWADAEDIVSEALLRAVRVPTLVEDTLGGLVSTITMRLATDLHRKEVAGRQLENRCTVDTSSADVEEQLCDRSEAAWLAEQVERLRPNEREVVLHRAAGHTVTSTANALGLSYKAVESAFSRARGHLRVAWEATLGVIIFLSAGLRRLSARSRPAMTALPAVAWLTIAALVPQLGEETPSRSSGGSALRLVPAVTTAPPAALGTPIAVDPPRVGNATTFPPDASRPSPPIIHTQVGDRRLVQAGVGVEDEDPNRPLQDQVNDCIQYGIIVSPSYVDCRAAP